MKVIIVIITTLLTACGTFEVKAPQNSAKTDTETSTSTDTATRTDPPAEDEVGKPATDDTNVNVNVDVNVMVNRYQVDLPLWNYSAVPMNHADARANAPEGYRLPTRAELAEAFDSEGFGKVTFSVVWTDTEVEGQAHFVLGFNLNTGTDYRFHEDTKLNVVYIRQ